MLLTRAQNPMTLCILWEEFLLSVWHLPYKRSCKKQLWLIWLPTSHHINCNSHSVTWGRYEHCSVFLFLLYFSHIYIYIYSTSVTLNELFNYVGFACLMVLYNPRMAGPVILYSTQLYRPFKNYNYYYKMKLF